MRTRVYLGILILLAFVSLLALPAHAQFTTITATDIQAGDGSPLAAGSMCWLGTNNAGTAIGYRAGTSGQTITAPVCRDIVSGAVATTYKGVAKGALQVADTTLTQPANVCYKVTVTDTSTGKVVLGSYAGAKSGYDCVQPSGSTWSFDTYTPAGTPNVVQVAGLPGPQGPLGPIGPAGTLAANSGLTATATFSDPDFAITVFPDTQCYTFAAGVGGLPSSSTSCDGIGVLSSGTAQFQWMSDNAVAQNIKAGIQVGDIVDRSGSTQDWTNADTMLAPAWSSGVPFLAAIGNHDWDQVGTDPALYGTPSGRLTTQFHTHIASVVSAKSYFGGSWTTAPDANYWIKFTNGSQNYGVITVEQCPRPGATTWAASVLAANPTYKFIFATHQLVYWDNQFMTTASNQSCSSMSFTDSPQEGIDIWNNFLSQHDDQIVLAVSGHIGGGPSWGDVGRISPIGSHGNALPSVVQNYQFSPTGGDGYLRIYKFHPSQASIDVQTFSPSDATPHAEPWNQFTVSYGSNKATGAVAVKGDVTGTNGVFSGDVSGRDASFATFARVFRIIYGIAPTADSAHSTLRVSSFNGSTTFNSPTGAGLLLNGDSGTGVSVCDGTGTANYLYGCIIEFAVGGANPTINYRVFNNTASVSNFTIRRYRGTQAAPLPLLANDAAYRISVAPYDGGAGIATPNEAASFQAVVSTDLTTGNHGIGWSWCTTPNGSVTKQCSLSNNPDGSLTESAYFSSARYIGAAANQPNAGIYNMAHSEKAAWRNNANTGDITIGPSGATDVLSVANGTFDATKLSGTVPATSMPALTGDIATSAGSVATSLSTTGVSAGSCLKPTVDVKGRVSACGSLVAADVSGAAPQIVKTLAVATQTAAVANGAIPSFSVVVGATYRVTNTVRMTVVGTAGTISPNCGIVGNTQTGGNATATSLSGFASCSQIVIAQTGDSLSYGYTFNSVTGSPSYVGAVTVERLQ